MASNELTLKDFESLLVRHLKPLQEDLEELESGLGKVLEELESGLGKVHSELARFQARLRASTNILGKS